MKIVLDTTILVRANERSHGLARELLMKIVESQHTLLLSNEILHELTRVLRRFMDCPRAWSSITSTSSADARKS